MKKSMFFGLLILTVIIFFMVSISAGSLFLTFHDMISSLRGNASAQTSFLFFELRLPRSLVGLLAGAAIGMGGAVLQSLTQNPLVDSGILGINAGAGFAVLLFIQFFASYASQAMLLPIVAFLGAIVTAGLIFLTAYKRPVGLSPIRLVLTGVVFSAGISALTLLLTTKIDSQSYRFVTLWQAGSIWGVQWSHFIAFLPWFTMMTLVLVSHHRQLDITQINDDLANSLGMRVQLIRIGLLLAAVALTSSAISITGGISFLGLIAPHIARQLGCQQHRYLLPASSLIGSILLLFSDTAGRLLPGSGELPAGIIVSLIGAPYFLFLLMRQTDI